MRRLHCGLEQIAKETSNGSGIFQGILLADLSKIMKKLSITNAIGIE
jgi:hypothetical protein